MIKNENLCDAAKRLLTKGIPLKILPNKTRYFLYPMTKADYNFIRAAIEQLRTDVSNCSYENAQIKISLFIQSWGFNPFKELSFGGTTHIKSDEEYAIIQTLFGTTKGKLKANNTNIGGYQCFCCKNFPLVSYTPHKTIKESWECLLIAYNNPEYAIVLNHKVDENGDRIFI